jgi:hypothetical protein
MHEDLETQLENQNEEGIAGGLPVDLTACAAARHLIQEGLNAHRPLWDEREWWIKMLLVAAQRRGTSCMRI